MKTTGKHANLLLTLAVVLALLLSTASCSALADMPKSIGPDLPERKTVHVSSADEFLAAIGNDTMIQIDAELIDFSTASNYGKSSGEFYGWQDEYDGPELKIVGVKNLQIIGQGRDRTTLQATPRYADVLYFENCENVMIAGLTAGHLKEAPGSCIGMVLDFKNCRECTISDCGLFGCGVMGITAEKCSDFHINNTEIYECSLMGSQLHDCEHFRFSGCSIRDCGKNVLFIGGKNYDNYWDETVLKNGENDIQQ